MPALFICVFFKNLALGWENSGHPRACGFGLNEEANISMWA
jgi:hypothetical protein